MVFNKIIIKRFFSPSSDNKTEHSFLASSWRWSRGFYWLLKPCSWCTIFVCCSFSQWKETAHTEVECRYKGSEKEKHKVRKLWKKSTFWTVFWLHKLLCSLKFVLVHLQRTRVTWDFEEWFKTDKYFTKSRNMQTTNLKLALPIYFLKDGKLCHWNS